MVVDGHVNELPPLLAGAERALASDPMAHSIEAAKPFDVNVKQLAGALTFVPANGRRRIDVGEPAHPRTPAHTRHRGQAHPGERRDPAHGHPLATQIDDGFGGLPLSRRAAVGARAPIAEPFLTFGPSDPLP